MSDTKPLEVKDWLDEQEFYDICQSYRHAKDVVADFPGMPTAAEAFEALKKYIRDQIEVQCSLQK
jgi:hypothetical protein